MSVRSAWDWESDKIRLTGGEPLVRTDLPKLIAMISRIPGIERVSMTTNGILLPKYLPELTAAGLHGVNISLDTLNPDMFMPDYQSGRAAEGAGQYPRGAGCRTEEVKVNTVLLPRDFFDDAVVD